MPVKPRSAEAETGFSASLSLAAAFPVAPDRARRVCRAVALLTWEPGGGGNQRLLRARLPAVGHRVRVRAAFCRRRAGPHLRAAAQYRAIRAIRPASR